MDKIAENPNKEANPKFETRNPKQIRMTQILNSTRKTRSGLRHLNPYLASWRFVFLVFLAVQKKENRKWLS